MAVRRVRIPSRPVRHHGPEQSSTALDVVICTYSNGRQLEEALPRSAEQVQDAGRWRVLVVDNNSTDDTQEVVTGGPPPGASPDSVSRRAHPGADVGPPAGSHRAPTAPGSPSSTTTARSTSVGARTPPPSPPPTPTPPASGDGSSGARGQPPELAELGWAFAEQDLGDDAAPIDCLVGAGMVFAGRRSPGSSGSTRPAAVRSHRRRLVSGGDVEMALRLGRHGHRSGTCPTARLATHRRWAHRAQLPRRGWLGVSGISAASPGAHLASTAPALARRRRPGPPSTTSSARSPAGTARPRQQAGSWAADLP